MNRNKFRSALFVTFVFAAFGFSSNYVVAEEYRFQKIPPGLSVNEFAEAIGLEPLRTLNDASWEIVVEFIARVREFNSPLVEDIPEFLHGVSWVIKRTEKGVTIYVFPFVNIKGIQENPLVLYTNHYLALPFEAITKDVDGRLAKDIRGAIAKNYEEFLQKMYGP